MNLKRVFVRNKSRSQRNAPEYGSDAWLEALPEGYARSEFPREFQAIRRQKQVPLRPML